MYFDVIAVNDPVISNCLFAIKIVAQSRLSKPPHITVRGPFEKPTSEENRLALNKLLNTSNKLNFKNFGHFQNGSRTVVFLLFESENLKKVWLKPSFPTEKYGINPHITLYDGEDPQFAKSLFRILEKVPFQDLSIDFSGLKNMGPIEDYSFQQKEALKVIFPDTFNFNPNWVATKLNEMPDENKFEIIESILKQLRSHVSQNANYTKEFSYHTPEIKT